MVKLEFCNGDLCSFISPTTMSPLQSLYKLCSFLHKYLIKEITLIANVLNQCEYRYEGLFYMSLCSHVLLAGNGNSAGRVNQSIEHGLLLKLYRLLIQPTRGTGQHKTPPTSPFYSADIIVLPSGEYW